MTKLIAHRGASAEAPENTLAALQRALSMKVDGLEFDVHISKDGVPVVIHDDTTGRTTNALTPKKITETSLHELKQLDAGGWFDSDFSNERIPTLEEVLWLGMGNCQLMIEVKDDGLDPKKTIQAIMACIKRSQIPPSPSTLLGSFSPELFREIQKQAPGYSAIAIVEEISFIEVFLKLGMQHLAIWYKLLDGQLIKDLHKAGVEIWAFTVDRPEIAQYLVSLKIDGIISNDPRTLHPILKLR